MSEYNHIYKLYETTNTINGKYYVGVHKQKTPDFDGYLGSGKILKLSIAKHGRSLFMREILCSYETAKEAYEREKYIVSEEFINNPNTYNIKIGGDGGWDHAKNFSPEIKEKMMSGFTRKGIPTSDKTKKLLSEASRKNNSATKLHKNIKCPHCGLESTIGTMKRWHFDNCKFKV